MSKPSPIIRRPYAPELSEARLQNSSATYRSNVRFENSVALPLLRCHTWRFQGVERLARPLRTGLDHNGGVPVVGEDVVDFNTEGPTGQFEDPAKQFLDLLVALEVPREWVAPGSCQTMSSSKIDMTVPRSPLANAS